MKIHHLDCGTLCPFARRWVNGDGSILQSGELCCHCLLIESEDGLILVDTGLGVLDIERPRARLGRVFLNASRPRLRLEETALHQVRGLGFSESDVRHIVITHGDLDHAGGVPDFPDATVHIYAAEHAAITEPSAEERQRYHGLRDLVPPPRWQVHDVDGERWKGFEAVRALPGVDPEVLIVPLVGHSRGHAGVAVRAPDGWWLHAGDAFFHGRQMDPERPGIPPGLGVFQRIVDHDRKQRKHNQERLRQLAINDAEVRVFCAHDPAALAGARARSGG